MSDEKSSILSHSFNVSIAEKYGIDCAIVINHFAYWIQHNQKLERNQYEGKTWLYQTQKELAAHFSYWGEDQVYRIIKKLVDKCVLIKGNFNKSPYDRTTWYAFKNEIDFINPTSKKLYDSAISRNEIHEVTECSNTDMKTNIKSSSSEENEEEEEVKKKKIPKKIQLSKDEENLYQQMINASMLCVFSDKKIRMAISKYGGQVVLDAVNRTLKNNPEFANGIIPDHIDSPDAIFLDNCEKCAKIYKLKGKKK